MVLFECASFHQTPARPTACHPPTRQSPICKMNKLRNASLRGIFRLCHVPSFMISLCSNTIYMHIYSYHFYICCVQPQFCNVPSSHNAHGPSSFYGNARNWRRDAIIHVHASHTNTDTFTDCKYIPIQKSMRDRENERDRMIMGLCVCTFCVFCRRADCASSQPATTAAAMEVKLWWWSCNLNRTPMREMYACVHIFAPTRFR